MPRKSSDKEAKKPKISSVLHRHRTTPADHKAGIEPPNPYIKTAHPSFAA
ncbi:hypothetical protein [Microcoleus sp. FACHB-68]|nr:hypothetical protein [Microcoleus sp. FACHB-68]MBD1937596.1 hypothetical protein [Microcoleus sp. FACHB-68]